MGPYIKRTLKYLQPHWKQYLLGQAAMLVATITALAFPLAIRTVFDSAFQSKGIRMLGLAILLLGGVFIVRELSGYVKNLLLGRIGQKVTAKLRQDAYDRLQGVPMSQFDSRGPGDFTSILTNDINLFQGVVSGGIAHLLQSVLSLAGVLFLLFRLDAMLSLSLFTLLPLALIVTNRLGGEMEGISTVVQEKMGTLTSVVTETISGIDVIRGFSLEREATGLFHRENGIVLDKSVQAVRVRSRTGLANGLLNSLYLLAITGFGAFRVYQGHMGPGDLIAFLLYTEMIYGPVLSLSDLYMEVRRSIASVRRIFSLMDSATDAGGIADNLAASQSVSLVMGVAEKIPLAEAHPCQDSHMKKGHLMFDHVWFGYGRKPVLEDISFTVQPGETIALIGASGVGKSTLMKLIPRLYEIGSGRIRIDGTDIRRMQPDDLRRRIASVPQHTHLFSLSIRDNIACGRIDATVEEITEAAKKANAHDFIMGMEHGYDTILGENGSNLSGGQKQRIAIARAFVRNPDILLLDEATASLDSESERSVLDALHTLMKGRTTLISAHRRTTIERADRVIVMENARVSAVGTHLDLANSSPAYIRLMNMPVTALVSGQL